MDELSRPQFVREELKAKAKATAEKQEEAIRVLWNIDSWDYILNSDTYLGYLISYLDKDSKDEFIRFDFYDFSMQTKFANLDSGSLSLIYDLAITMELLQVNSIAKEDLTSFLSLRLEGTDAEKTKSLEDNLFEILQPEASKDSAQPVKLKFEHHSVQEFLATKGILTKRNPLAYYKKLTLIKVGEKTYLKPSWSGVLRFLLESSIGEEVLQLIFELVENNQDFIDESLVNSLTTISPSRVTDSTEKIFEIVFNAYQKKRNWLPLWAMFNLWQFVSKKQFQLLKTSLDQELETETALFVVRGNIVTLIDSILEHKPELIEQTDQNFWKNKLIEFANYEGVQGVLQRESLSALKYFKDLDVIEKVSGTFDRGDKLTKESFVEMCSYISSDSKITIKYIAEGFKKGVALKARYAIYNIKTKKGLGLLLDKFVQDGKFLDEFLDDESIFSRKDEDKGDKQIVDVIKKYASDNLILGKLKNLIIAAFSYEKLWNANKSVFLKDIAQIIFSQDKNYPFALLQGIKASAPKPDHSIYELEEIFALLVNKNNLEQFFKKYRELSESRDWVLERIVYTAKTSQGDAGEELFKYALEKGLVRPPAKPKKGEATAGERSVYNQFKKYLEPEPGKYSPQVFKYFNDNEVIIRKRSKPDDIAKLKDLVLNTGLAKFDSRKIQVTLGRDENGKKTNQYSITEYSSFLGDVFRSAQKLCTTEEVNHYRQNIIDFVPFAYSEDVPTINEIIGSISEEDLKYIHSIYLDKTSDKRYFLPSAYAHFIEKYLKEGIRFGSVFKVLQSFVEDDLVKLYVRKEALEKINQYQPQIDKKWVVDLFNRYKDVDGDAFELAELASALLVEKFQDKTAIEWVLAELRRRAKPFKKRMDFHEVSHFEDELDGLDFAGSITKIDNDDIFSRLLELLEETQKLQIGEADYSSYSDYVWRIVQSYVNNKPVTKALELSEIVKRFLSQQQYRNTNWLLAALDSNQAKLILKVGIPDDVNSAMNLIITDE